MGRDDDAIAALSTGGGPAAVAIIRLSGNNTLKFLDACVTSQHKSVESWTERQLMLCKFVDSDGSVIDEPLAVAFKNPRSFTGQDSAEIHCHGGPYIVGKILAELYRHGFRPAEPGEFTRRAFLNGKLDLTKAEGIRELVEAQSHQQWLAARQLATGRLADTIEGLRQKLIEAMAYLEAQIDFPDEGDTAALHLGEVRSRVEIVKAAIERLAATYDSGRVASQGLMVALYGAPNAGKSTLMNELLGRDRAIVTPIAGTTRDYLEEKCLVNGRLIRLVDMAGVRATNTTDDAIEKIGIEKSMSLAKEADIVLHLVSADTSTEATSEQERQLSELAPKNVLKVITKIDLLPSDCSSAQKTAGQMAISCKSGVGIERLKQLLAAKVDGHVSELKEETFVTSARHMTALKAAQVALAQFHAADGQGHYEEMLAFELLQGAKALQSIIGEVDSEDVLDKVFSQFCIGK